MGNTFSTRSWALQPKANKASRTRPEPENHYPIPIDQFRPHRKGVARLRTEEKIDAAINELCKTAPCLILVHRFSIGPEDTG